MSAPIDQRTFEAQDDFELLATIWRGAMVDRYARCEVLVLKCLTAMRLGNFTLSADAFAEGAKTRLRALIRTLGDQDFGGRERAALRQLNLLLSCVDDRTGLAHGSMKKHAGHLIIEWCCCRGSLKHHTRQLTPAQMLQDLAKLDKLTRDLSSEVGQVCRAIRDRPA